ncbi:PTS transporter subunit EIIC [Maledivibacter halophilus]|uniref:PTS system, sucrose-specific IIC component n=1 Tax=Maledivibacter halophilus TaxID=36842 RepID=A0A1T5M5W0_9FIRM|nr:PTS transporter subunit EIIC [Maledivibacter halophilus]SKC83612.1 PTS system, sucrose-specific IIC component [Maledivibacter halophilus]
MNEFQSVSKELIEKVGGLDNIQSVAHCMTRLRLTLADRSLVKDEELKELKFVKGVNDSSGQLQIIFGTGVVNKVYKEVNKIFRAEGKEEIKAEGGNTFQRISRLFGDIFIPIIPVIVASGVLMGVRSYLLGAGILTADSSWYKVLAILIDTGFAFLPALVAWSATKKFGGSPALGIVLGLMLISPNLPAAGAVGRGKVDPLMVDLLGINFALKSYHGSVLVAVVAGWLVSFSEEKIRKIIPNVVDMILTPILTLAISFFIIIFGIGPIVQILEGLLVSAFRFLFTIPLGIGGFIVGGLQQALVITGLHHALWVIDINFLEQFGMNLYQPVRNASVLGQAGACMAFALFAKDRKLKSSSVASTVGALFGITEPAIFGTNLVYGVPFLFGMLGSAVGGMFSTLIGLAAPGMGAAGIPGILYFIGEGLPLYLIQSVITIAVPLVLTTMYIKKKRI